MSTKVAMAATLVNKSCCHSYCHCSNFRPVKGSTVGWFTEGSEHEGYVVCVFADGMYGSGGRYMEINLMWPDGRPVGHEEDPTREAWRPPSQVVGWKVACSCV